MVYLHGARPETELASQTGPAPEPDVASTSRMERELTCPVRGGSGSGPTWTDGPSRLGHVRVRTWQSEQDDLDYTSAFRDLIFEQESSTSATHRSEHY
jgi:hypothetical protein